MTTFSKFSDIQAVIKKASDSLPSIEQQYLDCLKKEKIPDGLLVDIKDYLANLRTALDYLWHKIPNIHGDYFPVANSKADFITKVSGVDTQIAATLESFQDYDPKSWLRCFNLFRNKNVHLTLVPQKRTETQRIVSTHAGGGSVSWNPAGVRFGSGVSINGAPINPATQMPISTPETTVTKEIWVDFLFDGTSISTDFPAGVSALPFLKQSLIKVQDIVSAVEQKL